MPAMGSILPTKEIFVVWCLLPHQEVNMELSENLIQINKGICSRRSLVATYWCSFATLLLSSCCSYGEYRLFPRGNIARKQKLLLQGISANRRLLYLNRPPYNRLQFWIFPIIQWQVCVHSERNHGRVSHHILSYVSMHCKTLTYSCCTNDGCSNMSLNKN